MNSMPRTSTPPLATAVTPAASCPRSIFDRPRAERAASVRPIASLHAIRAWLLAGFVGMSLLASALAHVLDAGRGVAAEAALSMAAGAALAWIASRRLATIARDADRIGSETSELQ